MPKSKNKRKNGKVVKHSRSKRTERINEISDDQPTGVSLQDLINVVAYQEYVKDGTIVADDVKVDIPGEIPVSVGEGENKRQVGTAVQVEGRDELSVRITDHEILQRLSDPNAQYSISTEKVDEGLSVRVVEEEDE